MIFFGPADFSQGIGAPNSADPRIDETRRLVAKVARKHGKFAGTVGGPGNFDALVEMGYTFISVGADVVALWQYFKNINDAVRDRDIVAMTEAIVARAQGNYITPGFLDGHIHPESSSLAIRPFAEGVLLHGTTGIMTDLHEIGVVSGLEGIEAIIEENEITDLNRIYLENNELNVELLGQGFTWLDTGTHESLVEATNFVMTVEKHQHRKIACLEDIALSLIHI